MTEECLRAYEALEARARAIVIADYNQRWEKYKQKNRKSTKSKFNNRPYRPPAAIAIIRNLQQQLAKGEITPEQAMATKMYCHDLQTH